MLAPCSQPGVEAPLLALVYPAQRFTLEVSWHYFFAFRDASSSYSAARFVPAEAPVVAVAGTGAALGFFLTTTPFIKLRTSFLIALGGTFGRGGAGGAVSAPSALWLASSAAVLAASCLRVSSGL